MRRYETIFILDPDLTEETLKGVLERLENLIPEQGGELLYLDEWGSKKLAYEIKKKKRGYYFRLDFCGTGSLVDEMERFFKIDDRILKYMTILLEKDADLEKLKEEKAELESKAAQQEETVAAQQEETVAAQPEEIVAAQQEEIVADKSEETAGDEIVSDTPEPEAVETETIENKSSGEESKDGI